MMKASIFSHHRRRGVALVMVLSFLLLISVLVIGFYANVTTEFGAAKAYKNQADARRLSESAVSVVMSQIKEGTAGFAKSSEGELDPSQRLAWASQPGALRTWTTGGQPDRVFKLYSSDLMVESAGSYLPASEVDPNWNQQPGLFTDINSPVLVPSDEGSITIDGDTSGRTYVASAPIIDPNGLMPSGGRLIYGDMNGDGKPDVEGFGITTPPTYDSGRPISPYNNPAPMPVRWMYVLKDGRLTTPSGSGEVLSFAGNPVVPTRENPIVGRIAFWADDETAKVNLNTASEGVFWDIPKGNTQQERELGRFQPARHEFNRFPGHPAMASLSAVFPGLKRGDVLMLSARYNDMGSQGGTRQITNPRYDSSVMAGPVKLKDQRLYASIDEFAMQASAMAQNRGLNQEIVTGPGASELTPEGVRKRRFFLTTNSRAPETNLFNMPRMSMWPINTDSRSTPSYAMALGNNDTNHRWSEYDRLFKFCSTIRGRDYFFLRQNNWNAFTDMQIPRNVQMFNYVKSFMSQPIPGYGGNFVAKYGSEDVDGLITQMFDYCRSGADVFNMTRASGTSFKPHHGYSNNSRTGETWNAEIYSWTKTGGAGQVVPLQVGNVKGFGDLLFPVQATLVWRCERSTCLRRAGQPTGCVPTCTSPCTARQPPWRRITLPWGRTLADVSARTCNTEPAWR